MGRGGSCCGSEEEENEDEVDYDPANKGNADDKINKQKMDYLLLFQGQMRRDPALMFFVCYCW